MPTLAFGNYVTDAETQDPDHLCADNELFRPAAGEGRYGAAIPLTPSWCALSMLFSDWDRSGRRDLRVSNDRHYYSDLSDGEEQLWRIAPGEPPRQYTGDDGWVSVRIQGMGIASYDVTGDGYPDSYLTSQGANVLQIAPGRAVETDLPGHGAQARSHRRPGHRQEAIRCPRPPGTPSSRTSTTMASSTCSSRRATSTSSLTTRRRTRRDLFLGQPDGTFVQGCRGCRDRRFRPRSRGCAGRPQHRRPARSGRGRSTATRSQLWRNDRPGRHPRPRPRDRRTGSLSASPSPARTAMRSAPGSRSRSAIPTIRRELTIGGGHESGAARLDPLRARRRRRRREVRVQWPDGEVGPWLDACRRPVRADRSRARPARRHGSPAP